MLNDSAQKKRNLLNVQRHFQKEFGLKIDREVRDNVLDKVLYQSLRNRCCRTWNTNKR